MKLVWSSKFTRSAKKLTRNKPELLEQIDTALDMLEEEPHHPKLRTHKLSGDFEGYWACSAGYDIRIVFEFCSTEERRRDGNSPAQHRHSRRGLLNPIHSPKANLSFPQPDSLAIEHDLDR